MYSLTLYIYPSPFGVDWRSPHHLTRSVVLNAMSLRPRTIGHVSVELTSEAEGRVERFFTGMTSDNDRLNRRLIFRDRLGLGVLFYQYDGRLESIEKLDPEREERLSKGNFSFIRFQLSRESYDRVHRYLHEYQARKVDRYYGLPHRPRHAEGAGCSAFAASFVEVAGVMDDEFRQHWSSEVRVPQAFLEDVPVWRLLIPHSKNLRWADAHEPGRNVFFWDPDMMHSWVNSRTSALNSRLHPSMSIVFEKNTRGILVDSSKIIPRSEPIWFD